jgi:hypothetical protein
MQAFVEEAPAAVEEAPSAVEDAPAAGFVEEATPAVEEAPAAVDHEQSNQWQIQDNHDQQITDFDPETLEIHLVNHDDITPQRRLLFTRLRRMCIPAAG